MNVLLTMCQVLLAGTMLLAATGKTLQMAQFLSALRLSHVPKSLLIPLAICIPLGEFILSFGLILSPSGLLPVSFMIGIGFLVIFTLWMVFVSMRRLHVKCGCFGTASKSVGVESIARNAFLLMVAFMGFFLALSSQSLLPAPSWWLLLTIVPLWMSLSLLQVFWQAKPALMLGASEH